MEYAATLPGARPDGMLVVGQSTGGFGTMAYDSQPHPRVSALVNGRGGASLWGPPVERYLATAGG